MDNESKAVSIKISPDLVKILDKIIQYIKEFSYSSINPSYYEASKFLAARINNKDLRNIT